MPEVGVPRGGGGGPGGTVSTGLLERARGFRQASGHHGVVPVPVSPPSPIVERGEHELVGGVVACSEDKVNHAARRRLPASRPAPGWGALLTVAPCSRCSCGDLRPGRCSCRRCLVACGPGHGSTRAADVARIRPVQAAGAAGAARATSAVLGRGRPEQRRRLRTHVGRHHGRGAREEAGGHGANEGRGRGRVPGGGSHGSVGPTLREEALAHHEAGRAGRAATARTGRVSRPR
mmetsp:Transcript_22742/g.86163  ORF Transcript_22742/g.86163 Transcript_22742/m.86163 type:complete len:234 (+) Transcript_22742:1430-2131(+)